MRIYGALILRGLALKLWGSQLGLAKRIHQREMRSEAALARPRKPRAPSASRRGGYYSNGW